MRILFTITLCFIGYIAFAHNKPTQDSLTIDFQNGFDSTEVIILVDGNVEYVKKISTNLKLNFADSHKIKGAHIDKVIIQIDNEQVLLPANPPPFIGVRLSKNHQILLQEQNTPFKYE